MSQRIAVSVLLAAGSACAAPTGDLVKQAPDFDPTPFKVYSGMLEVPGPVAGFDSLSIHYQFHESQRDPGTDPLALWHTGGPGGSSIVVGAYTEMGYFQLDSEGAQVNDFAWNKVANMLYLESPAGSGHSSGFSMCYKGKKVVDCVWDDVSQAEAYAHTIQAFYTAFPEFKANDLYLVGESYFGQYGPNIAHYILNDVNEGGALGKGVTLPLKGMALGNACWGGTNSTVMCNGYNSAQNDMDMYYGKGLMSKPEYDKVYETCKFPSTYSPTGPGTLSNDCLKEMEVAAQSVGPHDIYDIYDNCPKTTEYMRRTNKTMWQVLQEARARMNTGSDSGSGDDSSTGAHLEGGYDWTCGGQDAAGAWFLRDDVQKALHLPKPGQSGFHYTRSGPASVTLYPSLIGKIRIMIYNGDADACVPYKGNSEWIANLEAEGLYTTKDAWKPWFAANVTDMPAGYVTTYTVKDSALDFSYHTIRLAGHMVPRFMPNAALTLFSNFLSNTSTTAQY